MMPTSQHIAAASVSFTPLILVVTALSVDGDPWAQTMRSLPVCRLKISPLACRKHQPMLLFTGMTFLLFPSTPSLGHTYTAAQ